MNGCTLSCDLENELSIRGCWEGMHGQQCSLPCYGTIVNFKKLEDALNELADTLTKEQWRAAIDFWLTTAYLSPSIGMVGYAAEHWFKRKYGEETKEKS